MRFTSSSLALTLISLATISHAAVIDGLVPRTTPTHNTVCACISGALTVSGRNCGTLASELCTCTSVLSELVTHSTRAPIREGRSYGGHDKTVTALKDKIKGCGDKDKKTCTHPENSVPSCSRKDLCGYKCKTGYQDCGGSCKKTCSQATGLISGPYKRDSVYWGHRLQRSCLPGWTACGVPGGSSRDWECLDTQHDLESCGGCPFGTVSSLTGESTGADCTVIPNVADVACVSGGCAIRKCLPGYKLSSSGDACVEDSSLFRSAVKAAAVYGLEHIPLYK
ncbi:hypothetical protein FB451DRAFT_1391250 [Mycena latifolia]|nr:hypothetical protein FB451DRAFT_1391250 [Mycena latifolia]